jgi:hypothetical protein
MALLRTDVSEEQLTHVFTLMMEATRFAEPSVHTRVTWHYNPEDGVLNQLIAN